MLTFARKKDGGLCLLKPAKPDKVFRPKALAVGAKVEAEHTTDKRMARTIAKHHLAEDPNYYKKLRLVESVPWHGHKRGRLMFRSKTYRDPKTGEYIATGMGRRT